MPLTSGTKLGPYEIQAPIGAGSMGEVYRATDRRLDRIVAKLCVTLELIIILVPPQIHLSRNSCSLYGRRVLAKGVGRAKGLLRALNLVHLSPEKVEFCPL